MLCVCALIIALLVLEVVLLGEVKSCYIAAAVAVKVINEWSWCNVSSLIYALPSISRSMPVSDETAPFTNKPISEGKSINSGTGVSEGGVNSNEASKWPEKATLYHGSALAISYSQIVSRLSSSSVPGGETENDISCTRKLKAKSRQCLSSRSYFCRYSASSRLRVGNLTFDEAVLSRETEQAK